MRCLQKLVVTLKTVVNEVNWVADFHTPLGLLLLAHSSPYECRPFCESGAHIRDQPWYPYEDLLGFYLRHSSKKSITRERVKLRQRQTKSASTDSNWLAGGLKNL